MYLFKNIKWNDKYKNKWNKTYSALIWNWTIFYDSQKIICFLTKTTSPYWSCGFLEATCVHFNKNIILWFSAKKEQVLTDKLFSKIEISDGSPKKNEGNDSVKADAKEDSANDDT